MKKILLFTLLATGLVASQTSCAQADKSKRPSPPATVTQTLAGGTTVTIDYSKPSAKGRMIGKEIAPYGKVWRTGANETTWIEFSKDVKIDGKPLPAGKYGLFSIPGENEWTVIFNKVWDKWGTQYTESEDALRVMVKPSKAPAMMEQMTFNIEKNGKVALVWGDTQVTFTVK